MSEIPKRGRGELFVPHQRPLRKDSLVQGHYDPSGPSVGDVSEDKTCVRWGLGYSARWKWPVATRPSLLLSKPLLLSREPQRVSQGPLPKLPWRIQSEVAPLDAGYNGCS